MRTRLQDRGQPRLSSLESYCRRAGVPIGERPSPEGTPTRIHCPYCEAENELSQTYTEATVAYLKRILYRDFVLPQMNAMFAGLEDSIGSRHSGGMFSISVEFKHKRGVQPVRPIHGPDSAEFKIITFLCCGEKIKVSETWNGLRLCPFCAAEVAIV